METFRNKINPTGVTIQKEINFCPYCGIRLDQGARFCKNCGAAVTSSDLEKREVKQEEMLSGNLSERKAVYQGYIHKCPNCGEALGAFLTVCPSCGYEIRDARSTTSVRELTQKLESISAQKMPSFEENKSVMKMLFGKDFKKGNESEEAFKRFETLKYQEKASLIINFSVPNTKEDILEFMILAASNINVKRGSDDEVTKAWISKLDQVYQKAEISMGEQPEFAQIKNIYDRKKKELKNKRIKDFFLPLGVL